MATVTSRTSFRGTSLSGLPENFWEWLVLQSDFRRNIAKHGFYELEKEAIDDVLQEWYEHTKGDYERLNSLRNASHFKKSLLAFQAASLDFYSQTPEPLKRLGLFTIRTGNGNCVVFDRNVFPLPYGGALASRYFTASLPIRIPKGYESLLHSLSFQLNEQSFIRALHFSGVFGSVVKYVCGTQEYQAGPSGHTASSFPFWMRDVKKRKLVRFMFRGVSDLDECLYPRNSNVVIPIEAKIDGVHNDLGWHKLAFPCYRFINNTRPLFPDTASAKAKDLKIVPMYCLFERWSKHAYIYVFPKITIHKQRLYDDFERGIILNDERQFTPRKVFTIDMKKCCSIYQ
jgi:hypothetical protein